MPTSYSKVGEKQAGDPNILRVKDTNKVRPLDNVVAGWRQHGIQHPSDPEQFVSIVCPGQRTCPLCRKPVDAAGKQRFPVSRRFAANMWDYDSGSVKVLIAGPAVFDAFKEAAQVGIDVSACDWVITKSGQGIKTEYNVIRHDSAPFTAATISEEDLHDVAKYEMPSSPETIFEQLEKWGIDYDSLSVPSYTYEQALAFKMPYTKYKGMTVDEIVNQDQQYAEWMHGQKLESGQLGDPVFLALQAVLEEHGIVPALDDALLMLPEEVAQSPEPSNSGTTQTVVASSNGVELSPSAANMVKMIGEDGKEVMVPPTVVDIMKLQGFEEAKAPEPTTSSDANAPTRVMIGGREVELPREQALMLIAAGTAEEIKDEAPEPEPEPEPDELLPLPDEVVAVNLNGVEVDMPYAQAAQVVDNPASNAKFVADAVARAHARVTADPQPGNDSTPEAAGESVPDEKPFKCDQCDAAYKTQGALTNHKNRTHRAAEPQPSSVPVDSDASLLDQVKQKIAHAPFARDYTKMIEIFKAETGKSAFQDMDESDLQKLDARLDRELAEAALA